MFIPVFIGAATGFLVKKTASAAAVGGLVGLGVGITANVIFAATESSRLSAAEQRRFQEDQRRGHEFRQRTDRMLNETTKLIASLKTK